MQRIGENAFLVNEIEHTVPRSSAHALEPRRNALEHREGFSSFHLKWREFI